MKSVKIKNKHQEKNLCLGNKEFTQSWYSGEKQDQKPDRKGLRGTAKVRSEEMAIKLHLKQITNPGWMQETSAQGWCTGMTQRDGMRREVGGGVQDGEHM